MFFNKKRNSLTEKIYSGTPLIRSPMGQKNLAVLTEWPYLRGFFFLQNAWRFLTGGQKTVAVITRWPYYRGGRKAGFHCNVFQQSRFCWFILN